MIVRTRRAVLGAAASALAWSGMKKARAGEGGGGIRLGVATYSLRKFSRTDAIRMIQRLGVKYVNIKNVHLPLESTPDEIRAARKEFEDAGLVIIGGGNVDFHKEDEGDIRRKFEYAKLAGLPMIICGPTHRTLPMLEPFVKEYGIRIAVHNHGAKDYFPSPLDALKMVKNMDARCGVCVDVGNAQAAGADVMESIRASGARLFDMHIKDMRVKGDEATACAVGDGEMPVAAIFRQLEKMGYAGTVDLEYEIQPEDPFLGMARSYAYMRGVMAGIAA